MKRVYLEICRACNLDCPFCSIEKDDRYMTLDDIIHYLDEIRPVCSYVYLHILGEPLLHPDFEAILSLLDQSGFHLQLVSNGTLLHLYPDLLSHPCLRKLSVSVHSASDSTNDAYFETLDRLLEDTRGKTIELRFYDEDSLSSKSAYYRKRLLERYPVSVTGKRNSLKLKDHVYLYSESFFRWPDIHDPVLSTCGTCHGGIDQIAINVDGNVTLCCLDPNAFNKIGNLKKEKLPDILASEQYLRLISDFRRRKITSPLCLSCTYRLRFK